MRLAALALFVVCFALSAFVSTSSALPPGSASQTVKNFPVREPDEDSPLFVVWQLLKVGVGADGAGSIADYRRLCLGDRTKDASESGRLEEKEFDNLKAQAGSFLVHDLHGFKIYVTEMTPGPAFLKKDTKKVYITLKNQIESDERPGLFILEKDSRSNWKLRSLSL
ncbi:MAG: hypothetical protein FJ109_16205 [Deltaproteobacteria bacterium]|nr:hypothetical protein [Deltaproteobacteria bacterium]